MGALHLPLHASLDGAVHVELLDFDLEDIGDAIQTLGRIKDLKQLLLLFDRELHVGGDHIGQLGRIFHADGGDHGLIVQRLAKLYVLLK